MVASWSSLALVCGLLGAVIDTSPQHGNDPRTDGDQTQLLTAARIEALTPARKRAWSLYLETSARLRARDRAVMDAELAAIGRTTMTPGTTEGFRVDRDTEAVSQREARGAPTTC